MIFGGCPNEIAKFCRGCKAHVLLYDLLKMSSTKYQVLVSMDAAPEDQSEVSMILLIFVAACQEETYYVKDSVFIWGGLNQPAFRFVFFVCFSVPGIIFAQLANILSCSVVSDRLSRKS